LQLLPVERSPFLSSSPIRESYIEPPPLNNAIIPPTLIATFPHPRLKASRLFSPLLPPFFFLVMNWSLSRNSLHPFRHWPSPDDVCLTCACFSFICQNLVIFMPPCSLKPVNGPVFSFSIPKTTPLMEYPVWVDFHTCIETFYLGWSFFLIVFPHFFTPSSVFTDCGDSSYLFL